MWINNESWKHGGLSLQIQEQYCRILNIERTRPRLAVTRKFRRKSEECAMFFKNDVLIVLRDEKYVFVNAEKNREKEVAQIRRKCKKMHKQLCYVRDRL